MFKLIFICILFFAGCGGGNEVASENVINCDETIANYNTFKVQKITYYQDPEDGYEIYYYWFADKMVAFVWGADLKQCVVRTYKL